ncbi:NAD(P)H-dependent flavin oxidoreductase [Paracoccus panacisoli]|uniref:NAD(P)H-dependent flavin oxidoreductase n=1 Tax=Paracoccus panacisoli TaxID=1510163 RepID=A0ABV6T6X2_9RHOB
MPLHERFSRLKLPAIVAPMFLASGPDLVAETCRAGLVGTFPSLNQRSTEGFEVWIDQIEDRLSACPDAAPYGVNLIVHKTNPRLQADLDIVVRRRVPVVITSLGAVRDVVDAVHSYGGIVFHDVISRRHAEKAAAAGIDRIVAVCAGAGGHAGTLSPFALIPEIRSFFDGMIALSGAISTGAHIAAARTLGADLAYLGTRFLATREAQIPAAQKEMMLAASSADIVYTPRISGVAANFLRPSLVAAGLDPDNLPDHGWMDMQNESKVWKDLWSAGQGVGSLADVPDTAVLCARLTAEYRAAVARTAADPFATRG